MIQYSIKSQNKYKIFTQALSLNSFQDRGTEFLYVTEKTEINPLVRKF